MSRLPGPRGLRPPRSYGPPPAAPPPAAPCAPQMRPSGLRPPVARSGLRLPQASGLRPPQASGLRPPQASGLRPPQASGLRLPQASGLRPPQATGLRAPRPVSRLAQRVLTPPMTRSPCAPPPCEPAPPPCEPTPPPCPAASPRSQLQTEESDEDAAMRAALCAQWEAAMSCPQETPEQQQQRREEQRRAAIEAERLARARELAKDHLNMIEAMTKAKRREFDDACRGYDLTREAIMDMLMEDRDIKLRTIQEDNLRRLVRDISSEHDWCEKFTKSENWRRETLKKYLPIAKYHARFFANREWWEMRRERYRQQLRVQPPPLSPLSEAEMDVFDESPPCACPLPPPLPERVFDVLPPCAPEFSLIDTSPPWESDLPPPLLPWSPSRSLMLIDTSPPWESGLQPPLLPWSPSRPLTMMDTSPPRDSDLPPPLLRCYRSPSPAPPEEAEDDCYLEVDSLRDPCRELEFDSEDDDDSQLEGAVGGVCR